MPRPTGVLVLAVSALAILSVCSDFVPPAAQEQPLVEQARSITWNRCEQDATAQCASVPMPVDWANPQGDRFGLAVTRRKATDPAHRIGVLMINPGGPGGSGVDFVIQDDRYFSADILARFDIVSFDPRGVGGSNPVQCSPAAQANAPSHVPQNQDEFVRLATYNWQLRADCRAHTGPVYDHLDTLSVARDMDALRDELGESKISYYGLSYGTLLGQQYAEQFGGRIRAMVLDGNMDHSLDTRGYLTTGAAGAEDSLTEFASWCDRDPECVLHGRPVLQVWDDLVAAADRGDLTASQDGATVRAGHLIEQAYGALENADWTTLATFLDEAQVESTEATASLQQHAVICQDWQLRPRDYEELAALRQAERQAAPHLRYSFENQDNMLNCVGLPAQQSNPQHRLKFENQTPTVLLINSRHDPTTPYAWAQAVAEQTTGHSALLTYDGWGHVAYHRSDCVQAAADTYLVGEVLPTDLTCPVANPSS